MNQQTLSFEQSGETLRDRGTARVAENHADWMDAAHAELVNLASFTKISGSSFDADSIRAGVGDPPNPNCIGSLFSHAAKSGIIIRVGDAAATRAPRHASRLSQWRGK